mmetsp:Transcript_90449/g.193959  ORF Transcript_90449/g.193959 Transcript_90449/m.193959 type:complete len:289 (-) Transcript_90449:1946-2812(-)
MGRSPRALLGPRALRGGVWGLYTSSASGTCGKAKRLQEVQRGGPASSRTRMLGESALGEPSSSLPCLGAGEEGPHMLMRLGDIGAASSASSSASSHCSKLQQLSLSPSMQLSSASDPKASSMAAAMAPIHISLIMPVPPKPPVAPISLVQPKPPVDPILFAPPVLFKPPVEPIFFPVPGRAKPPVDPSFFPVPGLSRPPGAPDFFPVLGLFRPPVAPNCCPAPALPKPPVAPNCPPGAMRGLGGNAAPCAAARGLPRVTASWSSASATPPNVWERSEDCCCTDCRGIP